MKLVSFRVQNFRSINDSGVIRVDDKTALVGRNESGKSNLLLALKSLNPVEGRQELSGIKNFPRHRRLDECTKLTRVVETWWSLDDAEQQTLTETLPAAKGVKQVAIYRNYGDGLYVTLDVSAPKLDSKTLKSAARKLDPHVEVAADTATSTSYQTAIKSQFTVLQTAVDAATSSTDSAAQITAAAKALRKAFVQYGVTFPDAADPLLTEIEDQAEETTAFATALQTARNTVAGWLPLFVYVAEFPELDGHQSLAEYMQNRSYGTKLTVAERNFDKLSIYEKETR